MAEFEKIVVVTRKTQIEELIERFNTREQARFYVEHMGASFQEYQDAHDTYHRSLSILRRSVPEGIRSQFIERSYLPTFLFGNHDLVVTLGPDGLVVNTAKYLTQQPIVGFNPDPRRYDGILLLFSPDEAAEILSRVIHARFHLKRISMARAELNNGQSLYGVNDLFVGQKTHVSAYYELRFRKKKENQISSGIIVSTGAGSTGWFRSILTGAAGVVGSFLATEEIRSTKEKYQFAWDADYLWFTVREPFTSRISSAEIVCGQIQGGEHLEVVSHMPHNGVIFSDGIESDYLEFNSGAIAKVSLAEKKVQLISRN